MKMVVCSSNDAIMETNIHFFCRIANPFAVYYSSSTRARKYAARALHRVLIQYYYYYCITVIVTRFADEDR